MSNLTDKEKIDLINKLIEHRREMQEFYASFNSLFGGIPGDGESQFDIFNDIFDDYIALVANEIGED